MASLTSLSTIRPLKISRHFAAALNSMGSQRVGHNLVTKQHCTYTSFKAQKTMFPIVA